MDYELSPLEAALMDYLACVNRAIRRLDAASPETPAKMQLLQGLEEEVKRLLDSSRSSPLAGRIQKIHDAFLERIAFY